MGISLRFREYTPLIDEPVSKPAKLKLRREVVLFSGTEWRLG
jgi:hypothetical protein